MLLKIFFYLIIFLFGLAVGSFLNCVIYRLEKKESFLKGRSFCPYCKHILSWKDLVPLLSFLLLKGKCRYCGKKISFQYPLVEIATGLLFILVINYLVINYQLSPKIQTLSNLTIVELLDVCFLFLVSCFLIIIFVYDLKHYIIPDRVIYPAIIVVLLYRLSKILEFRIWNLFRNWELEIRNLESIANPVLAGLAAGVFFLFIVFVSRGRWMGLGDVKLAFFMGLLLGYPNILVALFLAFLIGAIIGIGLILIGRKTLKSEVPFGPFLVTGTFLALFWGQALVNWYLNLIIYS